MRKPYVPTKSFAALSERELVAKARRALSDAKECFEALEDLEEAREDHVRAKLCNIALRHLEAAARVIAPASIDS